MLIILPNELLEWVYSYLSPNELLRLRMASSRYQQSISSFLIHTRKKTQLIDLVCPRCTSNWISEDIPTGFFDTDSDTQIQRRMEQTHGWKRQSLLCQECDLSFHPYPSIERFQYNPIINEIFFHPNFDMIYNKTLYTLRHFNGPFPWTCLIKHTKEFILWNEYFCNPLETYNSFIYQ